MFNIIFKLLIKTFDLHELHIVGQSYDGAAVMSGRSSGLQAKIKDKFPAAIFTRCMAHKLNLALVDSCNDNQGVRVFLTTLEIYYMSIFLILHPTKIFPRFKSN